MTTATASSPPSTPYRYEATGVVANARLRPLLPEDWVDVTKSKRTLQNADANGDDNGNDNDDPTTSTIPHFLWENAPRQDTKAYRDDVKVYSHLPNGSSILDSKWVLGRLLTKENQNDKQTPQNPLLAVCETHCFVGMDGFRQFAEKMGLLKNDNGDKQQEDGNDSHSPDPDPVQFCDILKRPDDDNNASWLKPSQTIPPRPNLWVVKDAAANGAGGVWVVGQPNVDKFLNSSGRGPLYKDHKYIAQQYVWPPVTFDSKKCHVRVYATITYDGRAFVHQRAFLHVANEVFTVVSGSSNPFDDTVHITNCCANSHDDDKFAGEILADFTTTATTIRDGQPVVPLADFFPSVQATVAALCDKAFPFMEGGQRNNGFEYCGMDFMLSYDEQGTPLAYLLEINAPPSQDTATGLPHAENLHDDVLRDWMNYWVVPRVTGDASSDTARMCGWKCVYTPEHFDASDDVAVNKDDLILPSKATILNKIRWALFEKKALKRDEQLISSNIADEKSISTEESKKGTQQPAVFENDSLPSSDSISRFARSQFPYFALSPSLPQQTLPIFFENAGGAQVPQSVIDFMTISLQCRHRSVIGSQTKAAARETVKVLLGATERGSVVFGPNATGLLASLAQRYVEYNLLSADDEVVLSTENHKANFNPWVEAAKTVGATVKLWSPSLQEDSTQSSTILSNLGRSFNLQDLITPRTRIVAIPHASNVLGVVLPIKDLTNMIKLQSIGHAHVVVDGVAAAPHVFPGFDTGLGSVDWYAVSMHKLFGPHIGVLLARRGAAMDNLALAARDNLSPGLIDEEETLNSVMEKGTVNIEGCAGIIGLGSYFMALANSHHSPDALGNSNTTISASCCAGQEAAEEQRFHTSIDISMEEVKKAYSLIRRVEDHLVKLMMSQITLSPRVRLLKSAAYDASATIQLPTVSFVHADISSRRIIETCSKNGIICRHGLFLNTPFLPSDFGVEDPDGIVRISLAHYNTEQEVRRLFEVLETIPGW